ncbi:MAG TPA: class I SAM-dependent methyltransferase [Candidatus Levybacteria bacterium]|nr:class I SAM-dependent methyltransferase [Candidatus Levybacteria bacterium]
MSAKEIDLSKTINPFTVWEERAQIPGLRSVMSLGLSKKEAELESSKLVTSVHNFLGNEFPKGNILEFGTGIGRFTKELSVRSNSVTTLDLSKTMLERARVNCEGMTNVSYIRASADHIPTKDASFDGIFEVTVLLHMPDKQFHNILKEAKRVLKPGGKMFLCGPIATETTRVHQYVTHRTLAQYENALKPFQIDRQENLECPNYSYTMYMVSAPVLETNNLGKK